MKTLKIAFLTFFLVLTNAYAETRIKPNGSDSSAVRTCSTCAESSKFKDACRLVVAPCNRSAISEIDKILDDVFATGKPLVLYVHGRGNEPKKTWEDRVLEKLEADYGVKVIMFNWDSRAPVLNPFHRPVKEAHESAPQLQEVIRKLAKYRETHPESRSINVSLLVHSMGNLVLRKAMEDFDLPQVDGALFTNILMTGSDEDAEDHNFWIEKLSARETILVTINRNDRILRISNHPDGKTPLGLNPKLPLATNAYYLDTTGLVGKVHQLFIKGKQHGRVAICEILTSMLHGDKPVLEVGKTIKRIEQDRILIPIAKQDKVDRCFQGVTDESDVEELE